MQKLFFLVFLFIFIFSSRTDTSAQIAPVNKLAQVKTIFLDEGSFKIASSSCGRQLGGMFVPCQKDHANRAEFIVALRRWLIKYGFSLAADKQKADAILQGQVSIYYGVFNNTGDKSADEKKRESKMSATGWLVNDSGDRIWESGFGYQPQVSYKASGIGKISGKTLARKLQIDFKKAK